MKIIIGTDNNTCKTTCPKCKSKNIIIKDEDIHPYSATFICKKCKEETLVHGRMLDSNGITYFYNTK